MKETWGAGSKGLNFKGSGERGTPHAEPHCGSPLVYSNHKNATLQ